MKIAAFVVIFGFLVPLTSSQPTYDDDSRCGQRDDELLLQLLRNQFNWMNNRMSQLEALISQPDCKRNITESPRPSSCTCQRAGANSPCVYRGGYDCTCDYTNNCSSSHVCGEVSTCDRGYRGPLPPPKCTENLALLKPAIQSSQYRFHHATLAVDGVRSRVSCTSGHEHNDSWWAVDVGSPVDVARVCVTNDWSEVNAQRRLSYFVAGLTNINPTVTAPVYKSYRHVQYGKNVSVGATVSVSFAPNTAESYRYVIIQQYNTRGVARQKDALCLSEVKVFKREFTADPYACTPGTPGICHQHANCTRVTPYECACSPESSYRCVCNPGYNGDGLACSA